MAKFKKGDKVRIRVDTSSPFRGRIGIVDNEPNESATVVGYRVKFESKGNTSTCLFDEQVLETMTDT